MARIHPLYTGLFALLVAFGVFVSFKTTIFQHGGSRDLCSDMGGGNDVCGETVIVLKEFLDKVNIYYLSTFYDGDNAKEYMALIFSSLMHTWGRLTSLISNTCLCSISHVNQ